MSLHLKDKINYVTNTNPKTIELFQAVMRQAKQNKDEADELLSALFSGGEDANKLIEQLSDEQKVRLQKMADEITRHNTERSRIEERVPEESRSRSRSIPPAQLASPSLPRDPKVSLGEHLHQLVPEDRRAGVFTLQHHPKFDPDSDSEESDIRNNAAVHPQILNIPIASSTDECAPDLSELLESNQDAVNGNAPDAPLSPRTLVESPPHKPVEMMGDNNVLVIKDPEEDDPENYRCCGKYIQDMSAIMCESCNKWFHTCCLVKEPFKMSQPEVDFLASSGLDQLWEMCPLCEKEGRSRKRKRKESNDLPPPKRFKIRMKNLPPALLTQYQTHGIGWLRGLGIDSLLKCEYPNEETIPVERGKCVKLPEKCFSKDSLSFETRHVIHERLKPAINTLDAQQNTLNKFAKRWKWSLKDTTFEITDSSHMQILEYLEHEGFEYLNDEPPIRNLDPPKFYHELEQAAQDIFDENPINSDVFKKRRKTWVAIEEKFGVKILSELSRSLEDDGCFQKAFGDFGQLVKKDIIKILETPEFVPFRKSLTEKDFSKQFKQYKSILQKNGLEPMSFETVVGRLKEGHYNSVDQLIKDINDIFRCAKLTHKITAIEFKKIAKYGESLMKHDLFQWNKKRDSVADQGDKAQA